MRTQLALVRDSLLNFVSGLGTTKDKNAFSSYVFAQLPKQQLDNAYRGDWIARKAVDIPAADATREWRAWQADEGQIELIEATEKTFGIQRKIKGALQRARLYGGGGLVLGVDVGEPEEELRIDQIKQGSLKYVHCVSRDEIQSSEIDRNVLSPYYGQPKYYEVNTVDGRRTKVHPSRVVRFVGAPPLDPMLTPDGWGYSIIQAVDDAIKNVGNTSGNIAALVHESKIDVIRIPGLMKNMGDANYRTLLTERLTLANTTKSTLNTLIMDKEEEYQRISATFTGLPDILRLYLLIVSGAVDVPATRFLGQSAVGLGATGEGDTRNYYDRIASDQNNEMSDDMVQLDEILIRTAIGSRDPAIHYQWNPLYQMDVVQAADVALKTAQAHKIDVDAGLIDPEVLRITRQNQLVESGFYPGLEAAIDEVGETAIDEEDEEVKAGFEERGTDIADARPRTLYVRRDVLNSGDIIKWAKAQGFTSTIPSIEMHVTVIYTRSLLDWMKVSEDWSVGPFDVGPGGPRLVEQFDDGAVVLLFSSSQLQYRHMSIRDLGAEVKFPEYQPHVTITYELADVDLDKIEPYRGVIELGPEIFEEVDDERAAERFNEK